MFDDKLEISIEQKVAGVFLITLIGRVDSDTYIELDEKVKPILVKSTKVIILDMNKVTYVSSAGMAVVFKMKKFVEDEKGSFIIASLQPQVKKVFEIVKALPKENIFKDRAEIDSYLDFIQKKEIEKQKKQL